MSYLRFARLALPAAFALGVGACSPSAPDSDTKNAAAKATPAAKPAGAVVAGNACDNRLLGMADVAGILDEPITGTKLLKGDAQTCYFITASNDRGGPEVLVSVRPGLGAATIASFTSGRMNDFAKWTPLAGVGDGALWMPELREVQAQKSDVLCNVSARGLGRALLDAGEAAQQRRLGGLCNRIFAALKLTPDAGAAGDAGVHATSGGNVLTPACDHDIAPADLADLFTAPVTRLPGFGPQSCTYSASAHAVVTISLAAGDEGRFVWDTAKAATNGSMIALAGIGDEALQGRAGTYVVARRKDLVCSVDMGGTENADGVKQVTAARGAQLAQKVGAICAKVFAAR